MRRREPRLQRIVERRLLQPDENHLRKDRSWLRSSDTTAIRDAEYWRRCSCGWRLTTSTAAPPDRRCATRSPRRAGAWPPCTSGDSRRSSVPVLNDSPSMPTFGRPQLQDLVDRVIDVHAIALQQARQHRQLDVVLLGDAGQRAQILGQAGAAECEARLQIGRRNVQALVGANQAHDFVRSRCPAPARRGRFRWRR